MTVDRAAGAEPLRLLAGGAAQPVLRALAPELAGRLSAPPQMAFGVVGALQQRLAAGEKADVVLLPEPMLAALEQAGKVRFASRQTLGRVGIGVVVRAGADAPEVSTPEALRALLSRTRSLVFPDPKLTPTGVHMSKLLADFGLAGSGGPAVVHKNAIDGGVDMVARGESDVGFFLVTEVLPVPGIKLAGLMPTELQSWVTYGIGIVAGTGQESAAGDLVASITAPQQLQRWQAAGFEPAPR